MHLIRTAFAAVAVCVACFSSSRVAGSAGEETRKLLQEVAGFSAADWAAVEAGRPVARILDTDSREIAVAGAVRIHARRDLLVTRIREIENLERSAVVLDAGRFGRTPQPADLQAAPIEDYSLDLRECKPGDCRVRLAAEDIERFHREVDWRKDDWRPRALTVWRDVLAGYAAKYVSGGRGALPVYANKREALSVGTELSLLIGKFGFVARYSPPLHAYLRELGPGRPAGAEDTLYWTKEDFGVRPVFRISHQIIHPLSGDAPAVVVATNQVYADHYLDAALGVTLAIDASEGGARAFYMVAINRARTRSLSGLLRSMVRGTVQNRSRDAMRKILTATKAALEVRTPV
jgi:hypothetical protein